MPINKSSQIRQFMFILVISFSAIMGLTTFLSQHRVATAVAAPQATTCWATIDGMTVFSDTTSSPVQTAVNAASDNDLIKVAGTCIGVNAQNGTTQTVLITKSVTIQGGYTYTNWTAAPDPLLYPTVLDAAGAGRVVLIPNQGSFTVTLSNLHLINGVSSSNGAGIGIAGAGQNVVISNSRIYSNTSANFGGGLRIFDARVTIQDSQIYRNTSQDDGGGISVDNGSVVTIDNTQIFSNTSNDEGGGVHVLSGTVTIVNSAILENHADDDGGGLDIEQDSIVTVTQSMIDRNTATDDGGGIEVNGSLWLLSSSLNENRSDDRAAMDGDSSASIIIIHGTTISGNVSLDLGGNVDFDGDAMVHVSDSLIQNNQVLDAGGAGIDNFANLFVTNTQIIGNFAADDCGGIENNSVMTLTNVTISGNQAQSGAGVCTDGQSSRIKNSTIEHNIAAQNGGGIFVSNQGVMTITNSTIYSNTASQSGGLFNDNSQVYLFNSTVSGNRADQDGILTQIGVSPILQLVHSTLVSNTAVVTGTGMGIDSGTVTATNSIIAYNGAANCAFNGGTLASGNFNLEDGSSCGLSGTGDITNTAPLLAALADNGGDTETHALLAGSPAIDTIPAGTNGCGTLFTTDQRGQFRPFGDGCDIGSFEAVPLFTLHTAVTGSGSGRILSTPPGIDCGTACTLEVKANDVVTLTAVPEANSIFSGWSGACTNSSGDCVVTMNAPQTVTATFALEQHALSVTFAGTGAGTVTSDPAGIDCVADCAADFDHNSVVTLTATPAAGSIFAGWSGACTGTDTCVVTIDEAKSVTVTFDEETGFDIYLPVILKPYGS